MTKFVGVIVFGLVFPLMCVASAIAFSMHERTVPICVVVYLTTDASGVQRFSIGDSYATCKLAARTIDQTKAPAGTTRVASVSRSAYHDQEDGHR